MTFDRSGFESKLRSQKTEVIQELLGSFEQAGSNANIFIVVELVLLGIVGLVTYKTGPKLSFRCFSLSSNDFS